MWVMWYTRRPSPLGVFMDQLIWKIVSAVILALVEGITEFLPVSSTGHMIIVEKLLGLTASPVFIIVIQFGAILSICVIYFEYLWKVTKAVPVNPNAQRFAVGLLLAFLPSAALGVTLSDYITEYLFSVWTVAIALIVGGIAIIFIEKWSRFRNTTRSKTFRSALISRSGSSSVWRWCPACRAPVPRSWGRCL